MSAERDLAVAELLGVLAYGQLRSFSAMSSAVRHAPDARSADRVATFARREHDAYEGLRGRLGELTDLPEAAMDRQKALFDAFFDRAPLEDWFGASVFFAFGIPLARDFARTVVPLLDARSAEVLVATLDAREEAEAAALALLRTQLGDAAARRRARGLVAALLGRARTALQQGAAECASSRWTCSPATGLDSSSSAWRTSRTSRIPVIRRRARPAPERAATSAVGRPRDRLRCGGDPGETRQQLGEERMRTAPRDRDAVDAPQGPEPSDR
jgi:hypothetical protein